MPNIPGAGQGGWYVNSFHSFIKTRTQMSTIIQSEAKSLTGNQKSIAQELRHSGIQFSFTQGDANCPGDIRIGSELNYLIPANFRIKKTKARTNKTTGALIPASARLEFKAPYESVESDVPVIGFFAPKITEEMVQALENESFVGMTIRFKARLYQGVKFIAPVAESEVINLTAQTTVQNQYSPEQQAKIANLNQGQRAKFDAALAQGQSVDVALAVAVL